MSRYYVSITGLQVKTVFHYPLFFYYAIPSTTQAQSAPGNISASTKSIRGMEHTITVWEDRASMLKYLRKGAHLQAMKNSKWFGSYGKVYGYNTDTIPNWSDARQLWEEKGKVAFGKPNKEFGDIVDPNFVSQRHSKSSLTGAMTSPVVLVLLLAFVVAASMGSLGPIRGSWRAPTLSEKSL
jgi:hypothetical protein